MDGEQLSKQEKMMRDSAFRHEYYRNHLIQYGLLIIIFVFSLLFLFQIDYVIWKLLVIGGLSVFYFVFGIWHHIEENNLTNKHTLEYLIISAIIFVVLYSIFV